ncbi:MAG: hypothetical protein JWO33_123 [Caulobacteraceae bacterium]|nr:hypothetical protein [Caulobacteraceae bacterium]
MADPAIFYTGWLLDLRDRERLLRLIPPRYPDVVAEHVTLKFGDTTARPRTETYGEVVGMADDGKGVQALVVAIGYDGTHRPDGGTFHITWSLGPGRTAVESNNVIHDQGWTPFPAALAVRLEPRTFDH